MLTIYPLKTLTFKINIVLKYLKVFFLQNQRFLFFQNHTFQAFLVSKNIFIHVIKNLHKIVMSASKFFDVLP